MGTLIVYVAFSIAKFHACERARQALESMLGTPANFSQSIKNDLALRLPDEQKITERPRPSPRIVAAAK